MTEVPSEVSSPVASATGGLAAGDLSVIPHRSASNKLPPQSSTHSSDNKDRGGHVQADTRPSSVDADERRSSNGREASRGAGVNISQSSSVSGGAGGGGNGVGGVGGAGGADKLLLGSKIKHLKKPDGVPLWRKDIQFEFLEAIFTDSKQVFTNSYDGRKECTFADVYIDAMARSSKTSKILRDKLMSERANALNMAMVCLLVNVGRMNTTLNFFPEMKAQLRTYHAIPSLQSYTDAHAYKQLQDAPRLKSILKGACEDRKEPLTLEQLEGMEVPRTNPINLVFLLSTYAPKVSELHFPESRDFYDLIMRSTLSSKSRARAFLWLMWWYLEGDFTIKSAEDNPYGKGQEAKDGGIPCRVPQFEHLTEDQAALENVDATQEIEFGERMQKERKKLIEDIGNAPAPSAGKKGKKHIAPSPEDDTQSPAGSLRNSTRTNKSHHYSQNEQYEYDSDNNHDQTRSVSPQNLMTPSGNGTPRIILRTGGKQLSSSDTPGHLMAARSIQPSMSGDKGSPMMGSERGPKQRPLTSHQIAVQQNRKDRAEYMINRKLRSLDRKSMKIRLKEGAMVRCWRRIKNLEDPFDKSDDERDVRIVRIHEAPAVVSGKESDAMAEDGNPFGNTASIPGTLGEDGVLIEPTPKKIKLEHNTPHDSHHRRSTNGTVLPSAAGLIPVEEEEDDYGEEASSLAAAVRRTTRRLDRWEQSDRQRAAQGLAPATFSHPTGSDGRHSQITSKLLAAVNQGGSGDESAPGGGRGSAIYDETREPSFAGDEDEEMIDDADADEDEDMDVE
ncbi:uncharacterized protein LAJ45_11693 [Morchella importuna]|uniref:uncharacterized protein n=1 Tax=Morchella importuna TaxID=1174673 RepID=UPI001E8DD359|nr:uncharacterized protein LAJ45_11693 [Morchella importuna]KAH8144331.1 hypothetical protein LAJ45_11693 [Morchella importuna]